MSNNTTFAALKKNRSTQLSSLHTEIEKINNPSTNRNDDDRLWRAELDKSGNGYAVIRFLPASEGEDLPWVRVFTHGFQGPGGWYIENSLTTLGQKDPCQTTTLCCGTPAWRQTRKSPANRSGD